MYANWVRGYSGFIKGVTGETAMQSAELFHCARRSEPFIVEPAEDYWRCDRTCSYCGSMHPEDMLSGIALGMKVVPTDKTYKVYVGDNLKFYFQHFNEEQQNTFIEMLNSQRVTIGYPERFYVTPYFMALIHNTETPSV
jgi:hypothetical protein